MVREQSKPIFINYRITLSYETAQILFFQLERYFGEGSVFLDREGNKPGDYFESVIEKALDKATVLLVLIPKGWLEVQERDGSGRRRLDNEKDWVRREIAFGLEKNKHIIPILVEEATMPPEAFLPDNIKRLSKIHHPFPVRRGNEKYDFQPVLEAIESLGINRVGQNTAKDQMAPEKVLLEDIYPLPLKYKTTHLEDIQVPYVGLRPFKAKEASIYFGRADDIRKLINGLEIHLDRVLLLYGPSGVGKSSFLNAGILPRIEEKYSVAGPEGRDFSMGLHHQLDQLLLKCRYSRDSKPALLILDQVEEMFTNPNEAFPDEAQQFFDRLKSCLDENENSHLRVLLSFRFERLARILAELKERGLEPSPNGRFELKPLTQQGVREAIIGPADFPQFELKIHPDVLDKMTQEVTKDKASHIAPLLQLQLKSMWEDAVKWNAHHPVFDTTIYQQYAKQKLPQMVESLLKPVEEQYSTYHLCGLTWDILNRMVTEELTAGSIPKRLLLHEYRHIEEFGAYLEKLINTYLVFYIKKGSEIRLAHDALAPIVRQKFENSGLPGQLAWQITESKRKAKKSGYPYEFNEREIDIIKAGLKGMREMEEAMKEKYDQDLKRIQLFKKQSFERNLSAAKSFAENFQLEDALESLQLAAREQLDPAPLFEQGRNLLFPLAKLGKATVFKQCLSFLMDIHPAYKDLLYLLHQPFDQKICLNGLETSDKALWQVMQQQFFPEMVAIEGGTFEMGSKDGLFESREEPVHTVTVSDFYLATTPVTWWQFGLYCSDKAKKFPNDAGFGKGEKPIINVSWFQALHYCNWLSQQFGYDAVYEFGDGPEDLKAVHWHLNGFRLPTEAEWEFAARERGGPAKYGNGKDYATLEEINYDGGISYHIDTWGERGEGKGSTTPVKIYSPNALGLYDMAGNVYDWCWDIYSEGENSFYRKSEGLVDPKGPDGEMNDYRVVRGGSWYNPVYQCRCAFRFRYQPVDQVNLVGFRVSRRLPF